MHKKMNVKKLSAHLVVNGQVKSAMYPILKLIQASESSKADCLRNTIRTT